MQTRSIIASEQYKNRNAMKRLIIMISEVMVVTAILSAFNSVLFTSCGIQVIGDFFDMGYIDKNNHYVPKRPRFSLKNKKNNIIPPQLDTVNVYILTNDTLYWRNWNVGNIYYSGLTVVKTGITVERYLKFYPNGRCLYFYFNTKEHPLEIKRELQESDLNPNRKFPVRTYNNYNNYNKRYYHSKDGKKIVMERFQQSYMIDAIDVDVKRPYQKSYCFLNATGDTLTIKEKYCSDDIYVRKEIPETWRKYKVDW